MTGPKAPEAPVSGEVASVRFDAEVGEQISRGYPKEEQSSMLGAASGANGDRSRSSRAGNLILVLISLAISLGVSEGFLRLFPQFQVQTGDGEFIFCTPEKVRHRPDMNFGHTEVPGNEYFERYSRVDPWSYVHINAQGFRDNYNNGGQPVIVLGDSMTRGTLVNENETYTDLLDAWHPELSFRNYGIGGFGQANAIRVYEEVGAKLSHRLVIQQISLTTDLDDNVEDARLVDSGVHIIITPAVGTPEQSKTTVARIHNLFWNRSELYRWFYQATVRPFFANWDARRDMGHALELMRGLLAQLASETRQRDADLLLLVLPGWAEMAGRDDGMEPERQRALLRKFAEDTPGVFMLDATPVLASESPDKTYGIADKHLTPYGHFLVAQALDRWLGSEWPRGTPGEAPARNFVRGEPITADCGKAEEYLARIMTPALKP